jgi:hypothetical protein
MPAGGCPAKFRQKIRTQTISESLFMKTTMYSFAVVAISTALFIAGCTSGTFDQPAPDGAVVKSKAPSTSADDATIQTNLAKLTPEDRKLAEAQQWCAVQEENQLGEMAVPYKVMVKGQPVFLCCKGCKNEAQAEPDKTLAKVAELKTKAGGGAK